MQVDVDSFEVEMEAQRARSKDSRESIDLTAQNVLADMASLVPATEFKGYVTHTHTHIWAHHLCGSGACLCTPETHTRTRAHIEVMVSWCQRL